MRLTHRLDLSIIVNGYFLQKFSECISNDHIPNGVLSRITMPTRQTVQCSSRKLKYEKERVRIQFAMRSTCTQTIGQGATQSYKLCGYYAFLLVVLTIFTCTLKMKFPFSLKNYLVILKIGIAQSLGA